jgi:hypothetical protein
MDISWGTRLTQRSTREDCVAWLEALWSSEKRYHIDDNPHDQHEYRDGKRGPRTFTPKEGTTMKLNLLRCQDLMTWDEIWEVYYQPTEAET